MTPAEMAAAIAKSPFIDLGTSPNFGWEKANMANRTLSFSIVNNTTDDHTILLCPSDTPSSDKIIADGVIGGVSGLTCVSSTIGKTIADFLAHIAKKPTRVLGTQFESANPSQLNKTLAIQDKNFLDGNPAPLQIPLSTFKSRGDNDKTVMFVPNIYQVDDETEVSISVPARVAEGTPTRLDVTFHFGSALNYAKALYVMAATALSDPATAAQFNSK